MFTKSLPVSLLSDELFRMLVGTQWQRARKERGYRMSWACHGVSDSLRPLWSCDGGILRDLDNALVFHLYLMLLFHGESIVETLGLLTFWLPLGFSQQGGRSLKLACLFPWLRVGLASFYPLVADVTSQNWLFQSASFLLCCAPQALCPRCPSSTRLAQTTQFPLVSGRF